MKLTAKRKVENAFDNFRAKQQKHNDIHHMGNEITNDLARKKVFNNNPMQEISKMPMVGTSTQFLEHQDENDETDLIEKDPIKLLNVLFEDRNVETVVSLSPGANLQAMANYIIDNSDKFQKKPLKRIYLLQDELEPAIVDEATASKEKLKQSFFEDWKEYIGTHFKRPHNVIYDKKICNRLLHQHFLYCRTPFIEQIVQEFNGRFSTAAWFCFFVESNLGIMLRQYFLHLDQETWNIISHPNLHPRKRRINWIPNPEDGPFADSIREFYSSVRRFRADYDQLFQENIDRLMMHEKNNPPDMNFECSVCLGVFSISRAICCNLNPFANILINKNIHEQPMVPTTSTTDNSADNQFHRFCVECLIGHARAATQEMPLAMGGIGLQCMAPDCANPILFSECRFYIPPNVRRNLNARIVEENLGVANLENLERCNECNFAMIIEASTEEIRVFSCQKCQAKYCRKCQRQWDDSHIGRPCEEMSRNEEQQQHVFENKLSEAIIRRCHRCSLPFVKSDGCNKMSCRCGATMCYICRTKNINYNHFCQHHRNPGQKNCKQCKKKCLLWQPEEEADRQALEIIHNEAEKSGVNLNK